MLLIRWLLACNSPYPFAGLANLPRYFLNWRAYLRAGESKKIKFSDSYPCLSDWRSYTPFDPHYFYQAAWLARRLPAFKPERHIDIGSSVMTIGVLSATVSTIFVDYRPLLASMSNFRSIAADIISLPFKTNRVESLSCLHVIEHIGLGRYGDRIDPEGSSKAAGELQRVLRERGRLYLSVPVGRERVCFNAHRVFRPQTILELFGALSLVEFSFVDDCGTLVENQPVTAAAECKYGCGLFIFEKPST